MPADWLTLTLLLAALSQKPGCLTDAPTLT